MTDVAVEAGQRPPMADLATLAGVQAENAKSLLRFWGRTKRPCADVVRRPDVDMSLPAALAFLQECHEAGLVARADESVASLTLSPAGDAAVSNGTLPTVEVGPGVAPVSSALLRRLPLDVGGNAEWTFLGEASNERGQVLAMPGAVILPYVDTMPSVAADPLISGIVDPESLDGSFSTGVVQTTGYGSKASGICVVADRAVLEEEGVAVVDVTLRSGSASHEVPLHLVHAALAPIMLLVAADARRCLSRAAAAGREPRCVVRFRFPETAPPSLRVVTLFATALAGWRKLVDHEGSVEVGFETLAPVEGLRAA